MNPHPARRQTTLRARARSALVALAVATAPVAAQVDLRTDAVIYFGSACNSSGPATIDEIKVRNATPEWQQIRAHGISRGSARYILLMGAMDRKIRAAAQQAVAISGQDLLVRAGDITDRRGKTVVNLTSLVIANL